MVVDTRPTATIAFRKYFDEPIDLQHLSSKELYK